MSDTEFTNISNYLASKTGQLVSEIIIKQGIDIHKPVGNNEYHWLQSIANWINNSVWEYDKDIKEWSLNDGFDNIIVIKEYLQPGDWSTLDEEQVNITTLSDKKYFLLFK